MRAVTFGLAAATLVFLILSKKSWPPYLMLALFPVCLAAAGSGKPGRLSRWRVAGFACFGFVAVTEQSYWATVFRMFSSAEFHRALAALRPEALELLGVQVLLVAGYAWLLWEAMRQVVMGGDGGSGGDLV